MTVSICCGVPTTTLQRANCKTNIAAGPLKMGQREGDKSQINWPAFLFIRYILRVTHTDSASLFVGTTSSGGGVVSSFLYMLSVGEPNRRVTVCTRAAYLWLTLGGLSATAGRYLKVYVLASLSCVSYCCLLQPPFSSGVQNLQPS